MRKDFVSNNGKVFIAFDRCAISQLDVYLFQIEIFFFGKNEKMYLCLDECIKWHKKNINNTKPQISKTKQKKFLKLLESRRKLFTKLIKD